MTMPRLIELMKNNTTKIESSLGVPTETVVSWINQPELILEFGIIEAAKLAKAINIDLIIFIETLEDYLPESAWQ